MSDTHGPVSLTFLFRPDDVSYFPHHSVKVRDDFLRGIKFERQEDRILISEKHRQADVRFLHIVAGFVGRQGNRADLRKDYSICADSVLGIRSDHLGRPTLQI